MKTRANNIVMRYQVAGDGRWLTLIHGAGDNLEAWWNQIPAFSRHFRTLSYDLRAHGQTETPPAEYTTDLLVQDLRELLRVLRVPQTFVLGYSMGGRVALGLALAHPEMVPALILANSGVAPVQRGEAEVQQMAETRRKRIEQVEKDGLEAIMDETTAMVFSPGFAQKHPDVFQQYKEIRLKNDASGYLTVSRAMLWGMPAPDVSRLHCPTLIIGGDYDMGAGPEAARASQRLIAGARLVVLPTGHAAMVEQPQQFNAAVLDFLGGLPA